MKLKLFLGLMLAASATLAQASASQNLRLVLDSGWVLPVSDDGSTVLGVPTKLVLPKGTQGIYKVIEDRRFDRLYVVPQSDYAARGTVVFEWKSLRRLGFLPGVSEVVIPVSAREKTIATREYRAVRVDSTGWNARIEWLAQGGAASSSIQLRDRRKPEMLIRQHVLTDADHDWTLFQCQTPNPSRYLTRVPYLTVDRMLQEQQASNSTLESRTVSMREGAIQDCWTNGELLKTVLVDVGDGVSLSKVGANGKSVKRIEMESWMGSGALVSYGVAGPFALGLEGNYAMMYRHDGTAVFADFYRSNLLALSVPRSHDFPFLRLSGRSSDGLELYFTAIKYRYRSVISANYIEGGADRILSDRIYRISVSPKPQWIELNSPDVSAVRTPLGINAKELGELQIVAVLSR